MIWVVSRHAATLAWLQAQGIRAGRVIAHLGDELPRRGDVLIGSLPAFQFARLCAAGVRCLELAIAWPPELRGTDLSLAQLSALAPRLVEIHVEARGEVDPATLAVAGDGVQP